MTRANRQNNIRTNQQGIVAIFSSLILMVVISVIVVGFSQVARREVRDSLNRQLSTEASYNAESGINDANSLIASIQSTGGTIPSTTGCNNAPYVQGNSNVLSNTDQYSCLSINSTPQTISQPGGANQTEVIDLSNGSGSGFDALDIGYTSENATPYSVASCPYVSNGVAVPPQLPPAANWPSTCPPILQVEIVPIPPAPAANFSEAYVSGNVLPFFLYPTTNGTVTQTANTMTKAGVYGVGCGVANTCSFSMTNLNVRYPGISEFYVKITQYYNGANLTLNGTSTNCPCDPINFNNAQVVIDATGNASGVLKRTQVAIAVGGTATVNGSTLPPIPQDAIETINTLCKRLIVGPNFVYESIPTLAPPDVISNEPASPNNPAGSLTDSCRPTI